MSPRLPWVRSPPINHASGQRWHSLSKFTRGQAEWVESRGGSRKGTYMRWTQPKQRSEPEWVVSGGGEAGTKCKKREP